MKLSIDFTVTERFLRYVGIDTQSDPTSRSCPSTDKQKDLGRLLVKELHDMGIADAEMDRHGYVYATIPSNTSKKNVPVICFCSHMDTSPDCSGKDVNPIVHRNYRGGEIILPADHSQILRPQDHPTLRLQVGNDIITSDGTTLLGADNKAGVAEIMDAAHFFMTHPQALGVKHGKIRILFTPDEEIGKGVDKVDLKKLSADFGYTVDGEEAGTLEDETFSADGVTLTVHGFSIHPGFAKGRMENSVKIAGEILSQLPRDRISPETTEGREGFVHPVSITGNADRAEIRFIVRLFEDIGLELLENELKSIAQKVISRYSRSSMKFDVQQQYRNMKHVLDKHPAITEYAMEAIHRAGLIPRRGSIRGGTDGSRLSFMGLPCPNIFAGEHAFHSKQEWVSVQDMQKAVETIVHLGMIWEEKA